VITAITSRHIDDCGAYPRYEPLGCVIWSQVFPGVYRFKNARIDFRQAVTNKCPVGRIVVTRACSTSGFLSVWWISAHMHWAFRPIRCGCGTTSGPTNSHTPRERLYL